MKQRHGDQKTNQTVLTHISNWTCNPKTHDAWEARFEGTCLWACSCTAEGPLSVSLLTATMLHTHRDWQTIYPVLNE
jgi:hypothetical protein